MQRLSCVLDYSQSCVRVKHLIAKMRPHWLHLCLTSPAMATVLLIEDDADSAEPITILLRKRSHQVRLAANGAAALNQLLQGSMPDVVLLDLQMPVMDGITFLDNFRAFEKFKSLPVVVISALAPWAIEELRPYRVAAVLTKGLVDLRALAQSIDRLDQIRNATSPMKVLNTDCQVDRRAVTQAFREGDFG